MALFDTFVDAQAQITSGNNPISTITAPPAENFSPTPAIRTLRIPYVVNVIGLLVATGNASISLPVTIVPALSGGLQVNLPGPTISPVNNLWNIAFFASAIILGLGIQNPYLQYDYGNPSNFSSYSNIGMYYFSRGGFISLDILSQPTLNLTITDANSVSFTTSASLINAPPRQLIFPLLPYSNAGVNLNIVKTINFTLSSGILSAGLLTYYQFGTNDPTIPSLAPDVLCLDSQTEILMANGEKKPICQIQRGDWVAGNLSSTITYQVSRVLLTELLERSPVDVVKIQSEALGPNLPYKTLTLTANHPIIWDGARRPAKSFTDFEGIIRYEKNSTAGSHLSHLGEGKYGLYDLQFDQDGTFIANGMEVQSRSPFSEITPLPKELFHNQSLYREETTWDALNQCYPLDLNKVKSE